MTGSIGSGLLRGLAAIALIAVAAFVSSGTARAQDTSVSIVDNAFGSASITVEAGSTVTWTNDGSNNHTVTADDGAFDSGTIASGGTYSFTFDTPGTYTYHCEIHPSMTAEVIVTAAGDDDTGDDDTGDDDTAGDDAALPSTGVGSTASQGMPTALLALALVLAGSAVVVGRRRAAR